MEIPLALEAEPTEDTTEEIYLQYAFSAGQLLVIDQSRPWSQLKVQEIEFDLNSGKTVWSVNEKTYSHSYNDPREDFKCSNRLLVCRSGGLIWDREKSELSPPVSLEGRDRCRCITVSHETVVALDVSCGTVWNANDGIIKRFQLALRSDVHWSDYSAMVEPDHTTLLALFYDVESCIMIIQRYNMEGHLLNCDEANFEIARPMFEEVEGDMFLRQTDGTYVVKCVMPCGFDSKIAFIYLDPLSFRLFERAFRVPRWVRWDESICSILLRWQTVYCCTEEGGLFALALENNGRRGTKTTWRTALPLRPFTQGRLFSGEKFVLEVMEDAWQLFWFN